MKKNNRIETKRLLLKPFDSIDFRAMKLLLCNSEISETYMLPDFSTEKEVYKLFCILKDFSISDKHFVYGIYYREQLIGFINDIEMGVESIELGYVINPDMKNRGYATEALISAISELFRMGYSVVRAGCFESNVASKRVMEKSGMQLIDRREEIEYRGKLHRCIYFEKRNPNFR